MILKKNWCNIDTSFANAVENTKKTCYNKAHKKRTQRYRAGIWIVEDAIQVLYGVPRFALPSGKGCLYCVRIFMLQNIRVQNLITIYDDNDNDDDDTVDGEIVGENQPHRVDAMRTSRDILINNLFGTKNWWIVYLFYFRQISQF